MREWIASADLVSLLVACTILCVALTLASIAWGYAIERRAYAMGRKVFDVPHKRGQMRTEILGAVLFHFAFVPALALALHAHWITFSSGWAAELLPLPVLWLAFQVSYYPFHRLAHQRAFFWIHRWHHVSMVTTPITGLSMHPIEACAWVVMMLGPMIVLAQLGLLGLWGGLLFLGVHWVGNLIGHVNADFLPVKATHLSSLWRVPDSYHCLHHARFDGHYGFAAAYMDRIFGTEFADWEAVHDRVWRGEPLKSIREHAE